MKYKARLEVRKQEDQEEWLDDLSNWAYTEHQQIEQALSEFDTPTFVKLHVEPVKPRDGMVVYADGSDWNPGTGEGIYTYYGAAWHKLG